MKTGRTAKRVEETQKNEKKKRTTLGKELARVQNRQREGKKTHKLWAIQTYLGSGALSAPTRWTAPQTYLLLP